ncbi:hypothetical protein FGIG_10698 [Fasciola gigantica]|uniref:Uncharacterized protein n=1 Tax=Fasciola gigantica TaxID=46835 RepID=A0A504Z5Q3_FASGI|nr:hypothetical protein FGIG_10698 [Fasciola gigantica]
MNDRENTTVIDQLVPNAVDGDVIPAVQLELSLDEPQLTYRPKFPLPDEINQLPRDQTVCQYCGVSYLVLSEIKQLEERIEKQSSELIDLLAQTQIKDEQIAVVELENKNLNKQLQEIQKTDSSIYQIRNDRDNLRCQVDDLSAAVETAGATEKRCMHELTETRGRLDLAGVQADALRHSLIRIRSKCIHILCDSNVMNEITKIRSYLDKIRVHLELKDDAVTMHKAGLECRLRDAEEECATLEHEKQCMEEHYARNESRMVEKRRQWSEEQGTLKGDVKSTHAFGYSHNSVVRENRVNDVIALILN